MMVIMVMNRRSLLIAAMVLTLASPSAQAQGMEWDKLPEPKHLSRVLDADTFLGKNAADPARAGSLYVQVGAYKRRKSATAQAERIKSAGLIAVLGREGALHLVLMPETARNQVDTLVEWARRSGYPDAFIRAVR